MRYIALFLSLSLLSSCYGMQPQPARELKDSNPHPALTKMALLSTDGQNLSPAGPLWQQAGLIKMQNLLKEQGLPMTELASVNQSQNLLEQGFPNLANGSMIERLNTFAAEQQADWVLLMKQSPKPDLKAGFFDRQVRYHCEVAIEAYSTQSQRYHLQIKANGENGYQSFVPSATIIGLLTGTIIGPTIRLSMGSEPAQQQQSGQIITITQLVAGLSVLSIIAWDAIQAPVSPEERQQKACDQALQEAAKGLAQALK